MSNSSENYRKNNNENVPLVDWLKAGMILKNIVKFLAYINTSANKRSMIKVQLNMWYEVQNHYRMSSRLLVIQGS